MKIWDLQNGRCIKTVDAHDKFVTCMTWGRSHMSGGAGAGAGEAKVVNVLATGSVDQSIKVRLYLSICLCLHTCRWDDMLMIDLGTIA